jgi:chaperonin GroEL (HSP60 family)
VTLLIRGGSQRVVDEVDRSIHDALMVVKDVIEKPSIVGGGGAPEAFLASHLKEWADSFDGREQLAVKKFAEALEVIPLTIAENAGMDPIDTMITLRAKQSQGQKWTGIDARKTKIADMYSQDIVEPLVVKEQIIISATETACMILRIDDVIAISGGPSGAPGPPGM